MREDNILTYPVQYLLVLYDGMGGALDSLSSSIQTLEDTLRSILFEMNNDSTFQVPFSQSCVSSGGKRDQNSLLFKATSKQPDRSSLSVNNQELHHPSVDFQVSYSTCY